MRSSTAVHSHQRRLIAVAAPVLAVSLLAWFGHTQESAASRDLDDLSWMTGHWKTESQGGLVEELWMPPRGGVMLGLNRTVRGDAPAQFEYLRIEARKEGIFYVASPGGRGTTDFKLVEHGDHTAVFTNPQHDFPKRIAYRRDDEGRLHAHATGDDGQGPSWSWSLETELD